MGTEKAETTRVAGSGEIRVRGLSHSLAAPIRWTVRPEKVLARNKFPETQSNDTHNWTIPPGHTIGKQWTGIMEIIITATSFRSYLPHFLHRKSPHKKIPTSNSKGRQRLRYKGTAPDLNLTTHLYCTRTLHRYCCSSLPKSNQKVVVVVVVEDFVVVS